MSDENPRVIIIAGPNGAGKSTLAPFLLRDRFGLLEYVNADTIALGLSAFNSESVAFEAGRVMLRRLHDLASEQQSFAFESTLASRSYAPWIGKLRQQGYKFHLLFLWLRTAKLAVRRVKERVKIGGHDVPEDVIRRRYKKGMLNFFELYQTLADTWVIYDNSAPGDPQLVAVGNLGSHPNIIRADIWKKMYEEQKGSEA
jgi:predicted ABC-type ATPase